MPHSAIVDDMPALSLTYSFSSYPVTPLTPPMNNSRSHGKRRDPSYIPRPSNAFILFRSAFIRDRKVSDKVEGNHSSLSKIIGHSWKKLSPDEREKWEAEAVAAQAQHRAMYPDWRFRPGANALAKLKIKDGGATTRRRSARVKEPPDDGALDDDSDPGEKGKGKAKARTKSTPRKVSLEEMRCAKIADFVADGIRGEELEVAVKQWEGDRKMEKVKPQRPRLSRTRVAHAHTSTSMSYPNNPSPDPPHHLLNIDPLKPPSDDSSTEYTEPRSGSWDNYSPLVMQVSPTGTHTTHVMQEPNQWWGDSRSADVVEPSSSFGYPHQRSSGITEMGYENCGRTTHFDGGYVEYASFDSPHDASQNVEWTDLANTTDRHGLVTVLDNPYKDNSNPNSPHTLTPPTSYAPPLSDTYYYTPQVSPTSPLPPSSFSTLTGWAGDQTPAPPPPPQQQQLPSPTSSWYPPPEGFTWTGSGRFEHGQTPSLDSQDWDRVEYRTAMDLRLGVEPLRPMTFHDEIRRMHGGGGGSPP